MAATASSVRQHVSLATSLQRVGTDRGSAGVDGAGPESACQRPEQARFGWLYGSDEIPFDKRVRDP